MKGRDLVQEAQNLKESIRLAKLAVGFIAILLVGMMVGMLSGCASTPTNTVTAPSWQTNRSGHLHRFATETKNKTLQFECVKWGANTGKNSADVDNRIWTCLRHTGQAF